MLLQNLRYGFRLAARKPAFALVAVFILALGIAVNSAMFSVLNTLLFHAVPYRDAPRILAIYQANPERGVKQQLVSIPDYFDWRRDNPAFDGLAAWNFQYFNLSGADQPERVQGLKVTADFFPILGVQPALGRAFTAEPENPGRDNVVILSDGLWKRRYGADAAIIGRSILIENQPHTVIGVLTADFRLFRVLNRELDLFVPLAINPVRASRADHMLFVYAKLKAATSLAQARMMMDTITRRVAAEHPDTSAGWSLFAQDTWKIAPRLTLTYGVRYEINPAPSSRNGKPLFSLTDFDPVQCTKVPSFIAGSTICNVGINPLGTPPYPTAWGNLAPRIGAGYQVSRNPSWGTVLRAGFGIFYDTANDAASATLGPFAPSTVGLLPNSPCTSSATGSGFSTAGAYIQFPITNPACITPPAVQTSIGPNSPYTSVAQAAAPNLKLPYTYEFNVALQQALGERQSLTVSYIGALGKRLIGGVPMIALARLPENVTVPVSPTFPTFLVVYGNYADSSYNALQAHFQRQFYKGLGATASYTWGHSLDDASNFNSGTVFPFSVNRSSSDFDIRQTFAASLVFDAPTPFKRSRFASAALAHWSFAPIYHFQTGPPINPVALLSPSADETFTSTTRPNWIPGVPIYVYGAQCAAEYGGSCPGGRGFNNAPVGAPLGASAAQAAAAGCAEGTVVGAFCRPSGGINTGADAQAQGNAGRNILRGFHLQQLDLDIHRDFPIGERLRLRFEADIFNVFNHPNFASPSAVLTDANFGSSQSMMNASFGSGNATTGGGYNSLYTMGGPRAVQLALKLIF